MLVKIAMNFKNMDPSSAAKRVYFELPDKKLENFLCINKKFSTTFFGNKKKLIFAIFVLKHSHYIYIESFGRRKKYVFD